MSELIYGCIIQVRGITEKIVTTSAAHREHDPWREWRHQLLEMLVNLCFAFKSCDIWM